MKLRSFVGTLGLAALAAVSHAQLDKTVSFQSAAMEPKKVFAALSKVAGIELDAAGDFADEPLIVSVKDVKVQDLLDRIAAVLHGKWTDTSTGKRLERDKDALRALENAKAQARMKGFEDAVKAYVDRRADAAKWDQEHIAKLIEKERKEREQLLANVRSNNPDIGSGTISIMKGSSNSVSPATPALLEALRKLPVSALAAVGPGQRIVYAMTPTNVQKRLPFAANAIVDTFSRAHEALVRALAGGPADPPNVSVSGGLDLNAKPLQGPIQEVLLILTRRGNGEGVNVDLKLADGSGAYVGSASAWISPKEEAPAPSSAEIKAKGEIKLSPLAKELAENFVQTSGENGGGQNTFAISSRGDGGGVFRISSDSPSTTPVLSREALATLADPVRTDPQATFVSEGLNALAEAADVDLVASLPDRAVLPLARTLAKEAKLENLVATMEGGGVKLTREGDWATLGAKDWLVNRPTQMRRASAKLLYGAVVSRGYARLQELAKFSTSLGAVPDTENFGILTLRAIEPNVAEEIIFPLQEKPSLFQLMGTLDGQVFDNLRPETVFQLGSMSQAQLALLERTVYGKGNGAMIMGEGDFIGIGISTGDGPGPNRPPADGLGSEPTEIYPQGLPALGELRLKFNFQDSVYASVKGTRGGRFLTAEGLAQMESLNENQNIPELQSKMVKFNQFRPARSNFVNVQLKFGQSSATSSDYNDWVLPDTTKTGTYEELPQAFRDAVAKTKADMANGRMGIGIGPGRRKPPL